MAQTDFWKTHPIFFRNFNFLDMSWTDFWKICPSIFLYTVFFKYQGMSLTRFWKTRPYLDEFSGNRSVSSPKIL